MPKRTNLFNYRVATKSKIFKNPVTLNNFFMLRSKIFIWHEKSIISYFFLFPPNFILLKTTYKVALQYLLKVVRLFNATFYLKLNFKQKVDQKTCIFKNVKKN